MRIAASAGKTDTGRKRRNNEDAFVCEPPLFAIADGMGGAQAGEVASGLAAAALKESKVDGGGEARIVELIQEANRRVHERAQTDAAASGMGTTMTVALVEPDGRVAFGHVGDSRAYMLRGGSFEQITDDHSLVAELVRRGELSAAEAETHPQRSVITRALGTDSDVDVDSFSIESEVGDVFLICSDGLSDYVDGETLAKIMRGAPGKLDETAKALVQAANHGGGDDNITAVLFEIGDGDDPRAAEPDEATRETVAIPPAAGLDFDEEDTLHPEDGVAPPPRAPEPATETPSAVDTMVVSAADVHAGVAAANEPEHASTAKRALALLVILALAALIVALVLWGLAR